METLEALSHLVTATVAVCLTLAYIERRAIRHRLTHKRYKTPCPRCGGKGVIQPDNPILRQTMMNSEGGLPTFDCAPPPTGCGGKGWTVQEFKRGRKVEFNEKGETVSTYGRRPNRGD